MSQQEHGATRMIRVPLLRLNLAGWPALSNTRGRCQNHYMCLSLYHLGFKVCLGVFRG